MEENKKKNGRFKTHHFISFSQTHFNIFYEKGLIGSWRSHQQFTKKFTSDYRVDFAAEFEDYNQIFLIDTFEPLIPREEKTPMEILTFNLRWKKLMLLVAVWAAFLAIQVIKNDLVVCSTWYWVLTVAQFPATLALFGYECVKLYKESKKRRSLGNTESVCEATINWTVPNLIFCALCGILGGTVGGLLGSGGGFILGPLLLEIGVIPQVASATATFVMMFSSSLSVVEFYLLKRFPIPYDWW